MCVESSASNAKALARPLHSPQHAAAAWLPLPLRPQSLDGRDSVPAVPAIALTLAAAFLLLVSCGLRNPTTKVIGEPGIVNTMP